MIDLLFPSDNQYQIPTLNLTQQAPGLAAPIACYGSYPRKQKKGTVHFYTDDYRFNAIWKRPDNINAQIIIEPNFSLHHETPTALAIWTTYKKRWLASYWQRTKHAAIICDLNVAPRHRAINLLGIPAGWTAYATRGYTNRLHHLDEEHQIATDHANGNPITFIVYGGGKQVKQWATDHAGQGVIYIPEHMDSLPRD